MKEVLRRRTGKSNPQQKNPAECDIRQVSGILTLQSGRPGAVR